MNTEQESLYKKYSKYIGENPRETALNIRFKENKHWSEALTIANIIHKTHNKQPDIAEGDVIQTKFSTKQAQKGNNQYQKQDDLVIPVYDRRRNCSVEPQHAKGHEEPFDHFIVNSKSETHSTIVGVTKDNKHITVSSWIAPASLTQKVADALNRGGFSDVPIKRIPMSSDLDEATASRQSIPYYNWVVLSKFEQQTLLKKYPNLVITGKPKKTKPQSKKKSINYSAIANKILDVVSSSFPDGDPLDQLVLYMNNHWGINDANVMQHLNKAVKEYLGAKDYQTYLANFWDTMADDQILPDRVSHNNNPWRVAEAAKDIGTSSPYNCGGADAWYHRAKRPHKMVNGKEVTLVDPTEIAEYNKGYDEEGVKNKHQGKQYESTIGTLKYQLEDINSKINQIHFSEDTSSRKYKKLLELEKKKSTIVNDLTVLENNVTLTMSKDVKIKELGHQMVKLNQLHAKALKLNDPGLAQRVKDKLLQVAKERSELLDGGVIGLTEGGLKNISIEVSRLLDPYLDRYHEFGGAEFLASQIEKVAKRVAKLHKINLKTARVLVNDYVNTKLPKDLAENWRLSIKHSKNRVMKLYEFAEGFQIYAARVRVKNPLYNNSVDVAIFAKNPSMARALLQAQFGVDCVISDVRKIS